MKKLILIIFLAPAFINSQSLSLDFIIISKGIELNKLADMAINDFGYHSVRPNQFVKNQNVAGYRAINSIEKYEWNGAIVPAHVNFSFHLKPHGEYYALMEQIKSKLRKADFFMISYMDTSLYINLKMEALFIHIKTGEKNL